MPALFRPLISLVIAALVGIASTDMALADQAYQPAGQCSGLPKIAITSPPETCVGLVAQRLGFPRSVVALSDSELLIVDMGGWDKGRGRLLRLRLADGQPARPQVLLTRLDRPHGLVRDGQGRLWLSEATRISELVLTEARAQLRPVLIGAPGSGKHPLIGLAALQDGRLAFSTGSASDDCARGWRGRDCIEAVGPRARASVRVFQTGDRPVNWAELPAYVHGLRNSLALIEDPASGALWGADNGTDLDAPRLPPDELNQIKPGKTYGWPHCYGMAQPAPVPASARKPCAQSERPALNLPAHSAPLGAIIVERSGLFGERGLLLSLHGYAANGHRLRFVPLSATGQIAGTPKDVLTGWTYQRGVRPTGTPVGLAQSPNGSIFVTEDGNATLLRISPNLPTPAPSDRPEEP